jgi:predicted alpha/beta hydrolase
MRVTCIKLLLASGLAMAPVRGHTADAISFAASDRVQVFADYYSAGSKAKPLILLFHQAGSNRGEYATIGPTLASLGFNALAIDQRSGGNAWGPTNETVKHLGKSTDYGEALLDLEAALQWAKSSGQTRSILVWGSSYSALWCFCSPPSIVVKSRLFSHFLRANICAAHRPSGKPRRRFRCQYS